MFLRRLNRLAFIVLQVDRNLPKLLLRPLRTTPISLVAPLLEVPNVVASPLSPLAEVVATSIVVVESVLLLKTAPTHLVRRVALSWPPLKSVRTLPRTANTGWAPFPSLEAPILSLPSVLYVPFAGVRRWSNMVWSFAFVTEFATPVLRSVLITVVALLTSILVPPVIGVVQASVLSTLLKLVVAPPTATERILLTRVIPLPESRKVDPTFTSRVVPLLTAWWPVSVTPSAIGAVVRTVVVLLFVPVTTTRVLVVLLVEVVAPLLSRCVRPWSVVTLVELPVILSIVRNLEPPRVNLQLGTSSPILVTAFVVVTFILVVFIEVTPLVSLPLVRQCRPIVPSPVRRVSICVSVLCRWPSRVAALSTWPPSFRLLRVRPWAPTFIVVSLCRRCPMELARWPHPVRKLLVVCPVDLSIPVRVWAGCLAPPNRAVRVLVLR